MWGGKKTYRLSFGRHYYLSDIWFESFHADAYQHVCLSCCQYMKVVPIHFVWTWECLYQQKKLMTTEYTFYHFSMITFLCLPARCCVLRKNVKLNFSDKFSRFCLSGGTQNAFFLSLKGSRELAAVRKTRFLWQTWTLSCPREVQVPSQ